MDYIPGAVQAAATITIGYPFDTIKSNLQYASLYKNSFACTIDLYKKYGINGFYKGASVPYATLIVKRGIQFTIYEKMKKKYDNSYVGGILAALSMCWISSPMQNIKLNMQVGQENYKNIFHFIKNTYQNKGILGFYRGFRITFIRDLTFGTVYLGTYGFLRDYLGTSYYSPFFAGGCSSILTWSILMPIDYIKTVIQTNPTQTIPNIIKTTPLHKFWRGLGPTVLRVFPISGIGMVTYEFAKTTCSHYKN